MKRIAGIAAFWLGSQLALAGDLADAPPSFNLEGHRVVAVDFRANAQAIALDVESGVASARSRVEFIQESTGWPMMDLAAELKAVRLNGQTIDPALFAEATDPDHQSKFRVLKMELAPGTHTIEVDYIINEGLTFTSDEVKAGFFMSDLQTDGRGYWEQYGLTNFEFDQYPMNLNVQITGTTVEHTFMTNGQLTENGLNSWSVTYPSYYSASSIYFHIFAKGRFKVKTGVYQGQQGNIPVTVYSATQSRTNSGYEKTLEYLRELEDTYGAFAHDQYIAYITLTGGGMEYCGATMTSMWALGHEVTHSWFARGVMPAAGNSGWIDESIASWRDKGYKRRTPDLTRRPGKLGGHSPYRRHTDRDAYEQGAYLMSEFDGLFEGVGEGNSTGLKYVIAKLFDTAKRTTITAPFFQNFMASVTGENLTNMFDRYVYGTSDEDWGPELVKRPFDTSGLGTHPRPYTKEELRVLR